MLRTAASDAKRFTFEPTIQRIEAADYGSPWTQGSLREIEPVDDGGIKKRRNNAKAYQGGAWPECEQYARAGEIIAAEHFLKAPTHAREPAENGLAQQYARTPEKSDAEDFSDAAEAEASAEASRTSTPARPREIDAARDFSTAPTRAEPADEFEAQAPDASGDNNVVQLRGERPANDPADEPAPRPLHGIAKPAPIEPKGMVASAIPSTATTAKTWPETIEIERHADLLDGIAEPETLETAPALAYAANGGDMPDDMRPALDVLRRNRGMTWDAVEAKMADFGGPSREHLSNARGGTYRLSPIAARGVVAWMFAELGLPAPDAPDPETTTDPNGGPPNGKRARLPVRPPCGERKPKAEARGLPLA